MRAVKFLFKVGDKFEGIQSNLSNAQSALYNAKVSHTVSTQNWKLERRHILEIRETFWELSRLDDKKICILLESIIKEFENTLTKLKGN